LPKQSLDHGKSAPLSARSDLSRLTSEFRG
jgi:hypothetical protein